jgi:hypothetical protein
MISLKSSRFKRLKILLNAVGCPAHVECGVLASFLVTFSNILQNMYIPVGAVDSVLRSCLHVRAIYSQEAISLQKFASAIGYTK